MVGKSMVFICNSSFEWLLAFGWIFHIRILVANCAEKMVQQDLENISWKNTSVWFFNMKSTFSTVENYSSEKCYLNFHKIMKTVK